MIEINKEWEETLMELESKAIESSEYFDFLISTHIFLTGIENRWEVLQSTIFIFFGEITEAMGELPFDFEVFLKDQIKIYIAFMELLETEIEKSKNSIKRKNFFRARKIEIENCWNTLLLELNRFQAYHSKKITLDIQSSQSQLKRTHLSAQEQFHLLKELGFLKLDFVQELNHKQLKFLMNLIIPKDSRTIEGIINSEKPESLEIKYAVTEKHKDKITKILQTIKEIQ